MPPQDEVARDFMSRRGYRQDPVHVEKVDDIHCWYFVYDLPEGEVEIEVSWTPEEGWDVKTAGFNLED